MQQGTNDERWALSRRSVVRGAAWTVPVVAVAATAPAYAASPCDLRTGAVLDWDGASTTYSYAPDRRTATASFDPDGAGPVPPMTMTVSTSYAGGMKPGNETSLDQAMFVRSSVGGLGVSGLTLEQATTSTGPRYRADRGSYTFTFSRPVSNLTFTVTDIDSLNGDFWDVLEPSPGYTVVSTGAQVSSDFGGPNGSQRFYSSNNNNPQNDTNSDLGNVQLRYAGPISSFTLTYWNAQTSFTVDTSQAIWVSDMTFDYKPC